MVIDIILLIVIIFSAVWSSYRGFARAVIHVFQWVATILCALFFTDGLRKFLTENTKIDDTIQNAIASRIEARAASSSVAADIPKALQGLTETGVKAAAEKLASSVTSVIMMVISLLLILLIIKLICVLLARMFSKAHHHGLIGALDTGAGFLLGFGLGVFYALLLLAILHLVLHTLPDQTEQFLQSQLNHSYISGRLYQDNPVLSILQTILGL